MAVTVTITDRIKTGNVRMTVATVAFDATYSTGGEAITPNQFGMGKVVAVVPVKSSGYRPEWDDTNAKLLMYWGDNNNASDGPLVEVADNTDLALITATVLVIGR